MTAIPAKGGYVPPRGPDGRIILGPLDDQVINEHPDDQVINEHPNDQAPAPAPVRRIKRNQPTAFADLRPAGERDDPGARRSTWRMWLAAVAALGLIGLGVWSLFRDQAQPPPAPATESTEEMADAAAASPSLPWAIVAFAAPDGAVVGALEPGRKYVIVEQSADWTHINAQGSGLLWVRSWELDGHRPPTPTPTATPRPTAAPVVPAAAAAPIICIPVVDGDFGGQLGDACGATPAERQQRALELLRQADRNR